MTSVEREHRQQVQDPDGDDDGDEHRHQVPGPGIGPFGRRLHRADDRLEPLAAVRGLLCGLRVRQLMHVLGDALRREPLAERTDRRGRQLADVGTGKPTDRSPLIDTPQLTNIVLTAPYLHDGSARTLEEIWTVFNPKDTHGVTNDLQKDELNDLIEYLKIL